ncbi:MAG: cation:proton antiporter, partial [Ardenticatenaceae bacterium]
VLHSRPGVTVLGAAVVDDVLGILVLSVFVALAGASGAAGGGALALLWVFTRIVLYLAAATYLGFWLLPIALRWVSRLSMSEGALAFVVVVTLLFAWAAEVLGGVAAITGSFLAGVALSRSALKEQVEEGIHALAYAFFVPLFFVSIGLLTDARVLSLDRLFFVLVVTIAAIVAKIVGCGAGALMGGFDRREALQLAVGMVSRGEVGLIVATVGITSGIIGEEVFAVAVIVVLLTTLVTPLLLRRVFQPKEGKGNVESRTTGT